MALKEPHGPWNYFDPDVPDVYADVTIPPPATFTQEAYDALPEFIRELAERRHRPPLVPEIRSSTRNGSAPTIA